MAIDIMTIIKGLRIKKEGTLTPSSIDIVPGGDPSTTLTVTSAQTSDVTITLPSSSGTLPTVPVVIGQGGTGQTTKTAAFDALAPTTTKADLIVFNGTNNVRQGISPAPDGYILTIDSSSATGLNWIIPTGFSGILSRDHGGTGVNSTATFPTSGVVAIYPISLTTDVSGILPRTNGGTGITSTATFPSSGIVGTVPSAGIVTSNGTVLGNKSLVTGDLPYASATNVLNTLPIGTSGQVLKISAGLPSWQNATSNTVTTLYTSSQSYTVPAGVTQLYVQGVGGGGGGGGGSSAYVDNVPNGGGGGGGGSAAVPRLYIIDVTPGQVLSLGIGTGGGGGGAPFNPGGGGSAGGTGGDGGYTFVKATGLSKWSFPGGLGGQGGQPGNPTVQAANGGNGASTRDGVGGGAGGAGVNTLNVNGGNGGAADFGAGSGGGGAGRGTVASPGNGGSGNDGSSVGGVGTTNSASQTSNVPSQTGTFAGSGGGGAGGTSPWSYGGIGGTGGLGGQYLDSVSVNFLVHSTNGSTGGIGAGGGGAGGQDSVDGGTGTVGGNGGAGGSGALVITYTV